AAGHFSATLPSSALTAAGSPYTIAFGDAGDMNFTAAAAASSLTVVGTTGPAIGTLSASPNVLGPPNHTMINVFVAYTASDTSGAPVCAPPVTSQDTVN